MAKTTKRAIGQGRGHFQRFVDAQTESQEKALPLTHTTDAFDLREIQQDGAIKPRLCAVFDQELSYYYYGRPAYRKNGSVQANSLAAYAPIVFIVRPAIIDDGVAAFPFDSGAFKGELYSHLVHHQMRVEDFGLSPSLERIGRLVCFFFKDNKRYYDQNPPAQAKIGKSEFEAQSYRELTTYRGKNERDDRATTVEILLDKAVDIRKNLLAIVVPASFLKDKKIKKLLQNLDVHILPYTDGANLTPASQIPRLSDIVRAFYVKQGYLNQ
jgi:hypothetical protein